MVNVIQSGVWHWQAHGQVSEFLLMYIERLVPADMTSSRLPACPSMPQDIKPGKLITHSKTKEER
jgi:hypothetical protein